MSAKVYLVTTGTYSDYRVRAVFSSEMKAELYMEEVRAYELYAEWNDIKEYPLDGPREELPGAWRAIVCEDGEMPDRPYWLNDQTASGSPGMWPRVAPNQPRRFYGFGLTAEHARRSAEELRRQTLALEGKVVTGELHRPEETQ